MKAKNIVKYKEEMGPVSISVEIETPVQVGDTLKFHAESAVPSMSGMFGCYLPIEAEIENAQIIREAFLIEDADALGHNSFLMDLKVLPPYVIGNVESIYAVKTSSINCSTSMYRPLYVMGFDVDYGDGLPPKHFSVRTFLNFGFERVPYKVNSIPDFVEYKAWVKRKTEELSAQREKWLKENPCPM